jgi:general secretion pathway protein G
LLVAAILVALLFCQSEKRQQAIAAAMEQTLTEMRTAIRGFRADHKRPPASLDELVKNRYLRTIPRDPVTGATDWRVTMEESVRIDDFKAQARESVPQGIADVHSAAPGTDAHGKPWSEY